MQSIYGLTFEDFEVLLGELGCSRFVVKQVYQWIYRHRNFRPETWSNVSKKVKDFLIENYSFQLPKIVWQGVSKDKTQKYLLAFSDKNVVEAVVIKATDRLTLCLSSQVGCAIGCTFCHTGTQGLTRNLTAGEVVGQYLAVEEVLRLEGEKLTNIVYMGQGEPLHNFNHMKKATQIFLSADGLAIGQRRITLSTSGLVPQIKKLSEFPPVNLAISLHAAHNDVRSELMPINKVYDLKTLFEAIQSIPLKAHRYITYEYILIDEMNNGQKDIDALCDLLPLKTSKINLIPFNEYPGSAFKRPSDAKIYWFCDQLIRRGYICTVRRTKGTDILAACGQLKGEAEKLNLWQRSEVNA